MTIKLPLPLLWFLGFALGYSMGQRPDEILLSVVALGLLCYGILRGSSESSGSNGD